MFKEIRKIEKTKLTNFCRECCLFTLGNDEQFHTMLRDIEQMQSIDTQYLLLIAKEIYLYSDPDRAKFCIYKDNTHIANITNLMQHLIKCTYTIVVYEVFE